MPDSEENNINRALGHIEGVMGEQTRVLTQLTTAVSELRAMSTQSDQVASLHRASVDFKLGQLAQQISHMEPIISDLKRWRERSIGAIILLSFTMAVVGASATTVFKQVVVYLAQ